MNGSRQLSLTTGFLHVNLYDLCPLIFTQCRLKRSVCTLLRSRRCIFHTSVFPTITFGNSVFELSKLTMSFVVKKCTHDIVLGFDFSGGSALYYVDKERPSHKKYCLPTLYSEHWLLGDILLNPLISSYYYEMILLHLVEAHKVFRFSMKYVYVTYLCCPHPRFGSSQSLMINGH